MEKFNRAVRRHHSARLKCNRKTYWYGEYSALTPRHLGKVLHTPQLCSLDLCCGNARAAYGRTLPELLQLIDWQHERYDSDTQLTKDDETP